MFSLNTKISFDLFNFSFKSKKIKKKIKRKKIIFSSIEHVLMSPPFFSYDIFDS